METLTAVKDPNDWLDVKHVHYQKMDCLERWQRWRAILDGMDTKELKEKFLPKTEVELQADYEFRIKTAEFLGVTDAAINRLCGAVFGVPARIESSNQLVMDFVENCDGAGTSILDFFESSSPEAQGMGIAFIGIDRAAIIGEPPATDAAERATGSMRCFATLYTAEQVRNWAFDESGQLAAVIIGRKVTEQASITADVRMFDERRVITKTDITVWRKALDEKGRPKEGEVWRVSTGPVSTGLDIVPLVPIYGLYHDPMRGWSIHAGTMKADIARFNEETWSAIDRYRHANQLLVIQSDREIKEIIKNGVFRLLREEDMKYVSPTSVAFDAQENAIARLKQEAVSQSGTNPSATSDAPNSTTGESGIAQRVRFTHTEKRAIESHARAIEAALERVLEIVELWLTNSKTIANPAKVSFFTTFDSFEIGEQLSVYGKAQYWIQSPTWHREMLKRIAAQSMPDMDEAEKKQIGDEIDKQAAPDPTKDPATINAAF